MTETAPTRLVSALVLAPSWVIALALLVKGHADTGDGFSAGLIAAAGIVVHYLAYGREHTRRLWLLRRAPVLCGAGLLLVLVPVIGPVALGAPPLTHYPPPGSHAPGVGMLELSNGFVLETGIFLLVMGFQLAVVDLLMGAAGRIREDAS